MAIFTKKTEEKSDVAYQTQTATAGAGLAGAAKIPSVLVQPRISEKAGRLAGANKYVFKITGSANKIEVKKAVEGAYKVRVIKVNIITNHGKQRNYGRTTGRMSGIKKAVVTLKAADKREGLAYNI